MLKGFLTQCFSREALRAPEALPVNDIGSAFCNLASAVEPSVSLDNTLNNGLA